MKKNHVSSSKGKASIYLEPTMYDRVPKGGVYYRSVFESLFSRKLFMKSGRDCTSAPVLQKKNE